MISDWSKDYGIEKVLPFGVSADLAINNLSPFPFGCVKNVNFWKSNRAEKESSSSVSENGSMKTSNCPFLFFPRKRHFIRRKTSYFLKEKQLVFVSGVENCRVKNRNHKSLEIESRRVTLVRSKDGAALPNRFGVSGWFCRACPGPAAGKFY